MCISLNPQSLFLVSPLMYIIKPMRRIRNRSYFSNKSISLKDLEARVWKAQLDGTSPPFFHASTWRSFLTLALALTIDETTSKCSTTNRSTQNERTTPFCTPTSTRRQAHNDHCSTTRARARTSRHDAEVAATAEPGRLDLGERGTAEEGHGGGSGGGATFDGRADGAAERVEAEAKEGGAGSAGEADLR